MTLETEIINLIEANQSFQTSLMAENEALKKQVSLLVTSYQKNEALTKEVLQENNLLKSKVDVLEQDKKKNADLHKHLITQEANLSMKVGTLEQGVNYNKSVNQNLLKENAVLKSNLSKVEERASEYQAYFTIPRPVRVEGLGLDDTKAKAFKFKAASSYNPVKNNNPCYYNINEFNRVVGFDGKGCELHLIVDAGPSPDKITYVTLVRFNEAQQGFYPKGDPSKPYALTAVKSQTNIEIKIPSNEKGKIIIELLSIPDSKDFSKLSIINIGQEHFTLLGIEFFKRVKG